MSDAGLAAAAVATVVALVYAPVARWAWGAAAICLALWTALAVGLAEGAVLGLGAAAALAVESPLAPRVSGFNNLVGRLATLAAAVVASLVILVRVFLLDAVDSHQVLVLFAIGLAAVLYLLVRDGPAEESRAARVALLAAAAGWGAAGHAGLAVPLASAALIVVMALAPRRLEPA